jgi:hypothetical protein
MIKDKLKEENEELKDRIKAGAKEYSKLLEKYHVVKNQQFNSEINAYNDMSGEQSRYKQHHQPHSNMLNKRNAHNSQSSMLLRQRVIGGGGGSGSGASSQQQQQQQQQHHHDTIESDSAFQNKSLTQSMRGGSISAEIENTLLDALLSTSLYAWQGSSNQQQQEQHNNQPSQLSPLNQITTTSQPRMLSLPRSSNDINLNSQNNANNIINNNNSPNYQQTSDLSDDGLVHAKNQNPNVNATNELKSQLISSNKLAQEDVFGNNETQTRNFK